MTAKRPTRRRFPTSDKWAQVRRQHLLVYPECRACGTLRDVVVHHLRYRGPRGVAEKPGDLVTLCKAHHDDLHRVHGRSPSVEASLRYIEMAALDTAG